MVDGTGSPKGATGHRQGRKPEGLIRIQAGGGVRSRAEHETPAKSGKRNQNPEGVTDIRSALRDLYYHHPLAGVLSPRCYESVSFVAERRFASPLPVFLPPLRGLCQLPYYPQN